MLAGLAAYNSSSSDEEESSKSQLEKLVKPKKKILVPRSAKHSSDEDDEPVQKKPNLTSQSKSGSGLFAKLPAPRNTIGQGKQANRTFVPYVFSKKTEQKSVTKTASSNRSHPGEDADSSGDENEVNFFSFVEKQSSEIVTESNKVSTSSASIPVSTLQTTKLLYSEHDNSTAFAQLGTTVHHQISTPSMNPSALYSTNPSTSPQSASLDRSNAPAFQYKHHASEFSHSHPMSAGMQSGSSAPEITQKFVSNDSAAWQQDDRFKRLQGKSNRREKVEFVEIQADSALEGNKELLLKQISEEKNLNRMSHSKKKNKDMPSSQSKRKHQMSYLMNQAKEREIELKNSWAEGHAARNAAKNRYGF